MNKIVYFDELSASDFLDIQTGGKRETIRKNITDRAISTDNRANAGISAKFGFLNFFNTKTDLSSENQFKFLNNSLINTTISNTILTDFLYQEEEKPGIVTLKGYNVYAYKNSISYLKMYTPYLTIANGEFDKNQIPIDITKFDSVLETAKGYYELIAKNTSEKKILRFNLRSFRNNYGLSDLAKMDLTIRAIKVGSMNETDLDIKSEFNFEEKEFSVVDNYTKEDMKNKLDVLDVILAGVE